MDRMRMEELVEKLNRASDAYYNGQDELMSNKEFDELQAELKQLEEQTGVVLPNSPNRKVGAEPRMAFPKFIHTYPALSLDKTKDTDEFVKKFREGISNSGRNNDRVVLMWKEDGSTVQAYYQDGQLQHLVTRGNGEVGSDITSNVDAIHGIPKTIPTGGEVVVRGEALISYDDFNAINESLPDDSKFKNPRNLASASIQMLDPDEVAKRHVIVKAFNLVKCDAPDAPGLFSFSGRLDFLNQIGFDVVEHVVAPVDNLSDAIQTMTDSAKDYIYPVDGLVAAMDNYDYASRLEGTEHHPNIMQGYAFKWEDETHETVLREIEWSPSRTGLLNPVAIFDPVEIDGTTVSRASVHNLSIMKQMRLRVGNRITVFKANLVIPQLDKNLDYDNSPDYSDAEILEIIDTCPTCGGAVTINKSSEGIETVYCSNPNCPEKMIGKLAHFCERDCMDIQGMSEETIKKLVESGFIKEYADFFKLDQKPGISFLPGFGKQSWKKMCDAAATARTTDFVKFITALSIPNIGKGQAKTLKKYLTEHYAELSEGAPASVHDQFDIVTLLSYLGSNSFNFTKIDGFGSIMSDTLVAWIKENFNFYSEDRTPEVNVWSILIFTDRPVTSVAADSAISGKSFCITGKLINFANRQELVDKIESFGGKWVDSVSSKTDYLINNDVASTSGKNKKAKELNIPIISEQDFLNLLG